MTDLNKRLADEFLVDSHITRAAERAGIQGDNRRIIAWQMLQIPEVQDYIEQRQNEIAEKAEINAIWVRKRFKEISDRCVQSEPVLDSEGNETGEYRFDSSGANKATEMLGKIIGVFDADNKQKQTNINLMNFDPLLDNNASDDGTT